MDSTTLNATTNPLETLPEDSFFMAYGAALGFFAFLTCLFCCCGSPAPIGWAVYQFEKAERKNSQSTSTGAYSSSAGRQPSNDHMYNGATLGAISVCGGCLPCCCCLGLGTLLIAVYAGMWMEIEKQDYYGPMYVTGYEFFDYNEKMSDNQNRYGNYVSSKLRLHYGYDWACPSTTTTVGTNNNAIVCTDVLVDPASGCEERVCITKTSASKCSDSQYKAAKQKVVNCIALKYWNVPDLTTPEQLDSLVANRSSSSLFDPAVSPLDSHTYNHSNNNITFTTTNNNNNKPPFEYFYGDCDVCSAQMSIPDAQGAIDCKGAGVFLFFVGLFLYCCGLCCQAAWRPKLSSPPFHPGATITTATNNNNSGGPATSYSTTPPNTNDTTTTTPTALPFEGGESLPPTIAIATAVPSGGFARALDSTSTSGPITYHTP